MPPEDRVDIDDVSVALCELAHTDWDGIINHTYLSDEKDNKCLVSESHPEGVNDNELIPELQAAVIAIKVAMRQRPLVEKTDTVLAHIEVGQRQIMSEQSWTINEGRTKVHMHSEVDDEALRFYFHIEGQVHSDWDGLWVVTHKKEGTFWQLSTYTNGMHTLTNTDHNQPFLIHAFKTIKFMDGEYFLGNELEFWCFASDTCVTQSSGFIKGERRDRSPEETLFH